MEKVLEIIFTSDIHGHVFPVDYPSNRPEASGLLNMARQVKKGKNMLVLDGGDSLQGTPLSQYYIAHREKYPFHPVAEAFRAIGCDYFTLGNHDFNFGYETLKDYVSAMRGQDAACCGAADESAWDESAHGPEDIAGEDAADKSACGPEGGMEKCAGEQSAHETEGAAGTHPARCLCANVEDLRGETGIEKTAVHVLENGLRIGITGIVTDYVNVWEQPQNLSELRVTDAFEAAKEACAVLREQCDFVICIYHGGYEEDLETGRLLTTGGENVACKIARELDFDLLLTGHQHMKTDGRWLHGTYTLQPPANAGCFARVEVFGESRDAARRLKKQGSGTARWQITSSWEDISSEHGAQPYRRLLPLEQDTQRWLDEPVGFLREAILPEDKLDAALHGSELADLFNQVQLAETGADFSCTSLGNVPTGLKREVTMRTICGAYLFANTLVVLETDREVLRAALERCASYFTIKDGRVQISEEFLKPKVEHYNYDFYAGLQYRFDLSKPVGQRVAVLKKADGTELGDKKYRLVTSNYRATGTGGYEVLSACPVLWRGDAEMPELTAKYISKNSPVAVTKGNAVI